MDKNITKPKPLYTLGEEISNAITHGVGAGLSVAGTVLLIIRAAILSDAMAVVASAIYGGSLILLYMMSTMYHSLTNKTAKNVFRIFDHCTIFVLIAGTYTPYTLVTLRGWIGWSIFGTLWGLTALGIVFNSISIEKAKKFSLVAYIIMGWCILIALKPTVQGLGFYGMLFVLLGGIFYTVGIIFYKMKKVRYMHSVWHLFVLAGSIFQYFSIFFWVIK
ncbi:MAG: hemolysin III family protein [Clostridia bacterium]|nr:hemolysin III family protein [Clostridia bacterium]